MSRVILYRVLSLVWCFPTLGALFLLVRGGLSWPWGEGWVLMFRAVRLEEWVALLLMGVHGVWLMLWWRGVKRGRVSGVDSDGDV